MRIDDRNAVAGSATGRASDVEQAHAAQAKGSANNISRSGGDSVELSGASLAVRNYNSARSARLQQLAKSVQGGTYSVSPALVGQSLVNETLANGKN